MQIGAANPIAAPARERRTLLNFEGTPHYKSQEISRSLTAE